MKMIRYPSSAARILAVGSVALDTVRTPFGSIRDGLGGSATFFSASARFFAPVSVVAVVGGDFPARHLKLMRSLGVDTRGIAVEKGKTFRWSGRYDFDLNSAQTLKTELNVFASFRPKVALEHRQSKVVFLANIDPELQHSVLGQVRRPDLTACDTMNYWIETRKKSLTALLKKVDIFLCNEGEARELTGEYSLISAARWLMARGPRICVIKKGEHGVLCFTRDSLFSSPAFLLEKVFDPTGAGDTFAGGFIGSLASAPGRIDQSRIRKAIVYGTVLASYNVESFSLKRIAALTPREIESRYKVYRSLTQF